MDGGSVSFSRFFAADADFDDVFQWFILFTTQWKHTYDPHIYVIPQCSLHDKEGTTNNNNTNIDT